MKLRETCEVYYGHVRLRDVTVDDYLRFFGPRAASFLYFDYISYFIFVSVVFLTQ